jgi:hypothetical protein
VHVVERVTGAAGAFALAGTICRDDRGRYVAHATTYPLMPGRSRRALRAVAIAAARGPDIEVTADTLADARIRLCLQAKATLGATATSFAWRPMLDLVR